MIYYVGNHKRARDYALLNAAYWPAVVVVNSPDCLRGIRFKDTDEVVWDEGWRDLVTGPREILDAVERLQSIRDQRHRLTKEMLVIYLFPWELESMPEYSASIPTGKTIGKWWRRRVDPGWWVGCYAAEAGGWVSIMWWRVEVREGPRPPVYGAPDWSGQPSRNRTKETKVHGNQSR